MVGGTFDPLHDGHKHLLNRSFEVAGPDGHVAIGLTSDTFASRKNHPIRPFALRRKQNSNGSFPPAHPRPTGISNP